MGRFLRSVFALIGVVAIILCAGVVVSGLSAPPGQRAALIGFGIGMGLLAAAFVWLLRKPFFLPRREARSRKRP